MNDDIGYHEIASNYLVIYYLITVTTLCQYPVKGYKESRATLESGGAGIKTGY